MNTYSHLNINKYFCYIRINSRLFIFIIDVANVDVSLHTVNRRLNENGIWARVPAHKEMLTEAHRQKRFELAMEYRDRDVEWWKKGAFMDESSVGYNFIRYN
jgi:hypothetical protein